MIPIPVGWDLRVLAVVLKWVALAGLVLALAAACTSRESAIQELARAEQDKKNLERALEDTHAAYARAETARARLANEQRITRKNLENANAALDQALREAPDWSATAVPAAVLDSLRLQPANARSP